MKTANQIDLLIEKIKELGYSVKIKNVGDHKVIMWSTKNHWASGVNFRFSLLSISYLVVVIATIFEFLYICKEKRLFLLLLIVLIR